MLFPQISYQGRICAKAVSARVFIERVIKLSITLGSACARLSSKVTLRTEQQLAERWHPPDLSDRLIHRGQ